MSIDDGIATANREALILHTFERAVQALNTSVGMLAAEVSL